MATGEPDVQRLPRYRLRPPRTFAPAFEALLSTARPDIVQRIRTSTQNTMFDRRACKNGHVVTPETIIIAPYGTRVLTVCRVCKEAADRRRDARPRRWSPRPPRCIKVTRARLELVMEALREGKTLNAIYGRRGNTYVGGKIIDPASLGNFRKEHPQFDRLITKLAQQNREKARLVSRRAIAAPVVMRGDGANVYAAVVRATDGLADAIRDDVRADMLLALAEGRMKLREVASRVTEFVRAHNRRFTHYAPTGGFMLSIDQPAFDDATMTIGERVTKNLWSGGICA